MLPIIQRSSLVRRMRHRQLLLLALPAETRQSITQHRQWQLESHRLLSSTSGSSGSGSSISGSSKLKIKKTAATVREELLTSDASLENENKTTEVIVQSKEHSQQQSQSQRRQQQQQKFSNSSSRSSDRSASRHKQAAAGQQAMFATKVGAAANAAMAIAKGSVGLSIHSTGLIADAANNLGDLLCDAVVYFSVAEARKVATPDRPWGRGKFEPLGALSVAGLLFATGAGIGYTAVLAGLDIAAASGALPQYYAELFHSGDIMGKLIEQFFHSSSSAIDAGSSINSSSNGIGSSVDSSSIDGTGSHVTTNHPLADGYSSHSSSVISSSNSSSSSSIGSDNSSNSTNSSSSGGSSGVVAVLEGLAGSDRSAQFAALGVAGASVLAKETLFRYTLQAGTAARSDAVIANAWQHRADVSISLAVLVGLIGSMNGFPILDPLAGLLVAGIIARQGIATARDALKDLSDAPAGAQETALLKRTILGVNGVLSVEDLKARKSGPYLYVEVTVGVDGNISASAAHRLAELTRLELMHEHRERVANVVVHVNPLGSAGLGEQSPHWARDHDFIVSSIKQAAKEVKEVLAVTEVQVYYKDNGEIAAKLDIVLQPNLTIQQAHWIAVKTRRKIVRVLPGMADIDVDLELDEVDEHSNSGYDSNSSDSDSDNDDDSSSNEFKTEDTEDSKNESDKKKAHHSSRKHKNSSSTSSSSSEQKETKQRKSSESIDSIAIDRLDEVAEVTKNSSSSSDLENISTSKMVDESTTRSS